MKDKRNRHGAVGKSSSEHFRKSAIITFIYILCEISGALATPSATGSYSRQADEIQLNF